MPRVKFAVGGWFGASCVIAAALWACSGKENDLFSNPPRGGQTSTGGSGTAGDGISGGTSGNGGTPTGGTSGSSSGGVSTGGMTQTGGTTGEGGAAAEAGTDSGGTTTGGTGLTSGAGGTGTSGNGGASAMGGVGMGGAGAGGAGAGSAGTGGTGGSPGGCKLDSDCASTQFCKKSSCDAEEGSCTARGPECRGDDAVFEPICGCDGITYWNLCVIAHEGFNIASMGECTGNNRPTCTRDDGADSCPARAHAHCYRPVEMCGDGSPDEGVCWVLPTECPDDEPQAERYCGGTDGEARCIGLCEVIDAENSFRRDSPMCD